LVMWHTVSKLCCSYQRGFLMVSSAHKFCR